MVQKLKIVSSFWLKLPVKMMPVFLLLLLTSCASYQPKPLSTQIALADKPAALKAVQLPPAESGKVTLTMAQLTTLALYNNPQLKASRFRLKVAGAQLYAAGLLPDPALSLGVDRPMGNSAGLVNAWSLGLGYDLLGLVTRQAQRDVQRYAKERVNLELVWQEWQVVQQARSLAVRYVSELRQLALLREAFGQYQQRYEKSAKALAAGDVTLDVNGTDLTAFVDVSSQANKLDQSHNETRHSLNQLLGLAPGIVLNIQSLPVMEPTDPGQIKARLDSLPQRRPDLMALKAGYSSQEARVHAAILAQFPSLSIGFNRARDTGGLNTAGLSISLNLPLFSGNRGNIAIERATREQLKVEYEARLVQTTIDVDKLSELQGIVARQATLLKEYLPTLQKLVSHARAARDRGDMDALTYLNLETTWINQQLEQIRLEQLQQETEIALLTALALPGGAPSASPDSE